MKQLLSGNEAIALGGAVFGASVATGYPGTPATEILEQISKYDGVYAEWSVNEKIDLEVALGASQGGVRSLVAMKHVGLNAAADPFMAIPYTGVDGGLLVVSADDPGIHSSQNEQDNRHFARMAKCPMLEPSDSKEAFEYVGLGFQISERFDTPVLLRLTTRICHSRSVIDGPVTKNLKKRNGRFKRRPEKYVLLPSRCRTRHKIIEDRIVELAKFSDLFQENKWESGILPIGIISSGIAYQYAKEACPQASFLKLGMTYPLPGELIKRFSKDKALLLVVEELDPFLEEGVNALGVKAEGKRYFPSFGELNPDIVSDGIAQALGKSKIKRKNFIQVPPRLPQLCPTCPYWKIFKVLKDLEIVVVGDIGCYTLSHYAPIEAIDTTTCMGASIGQAHGLEKALGESISKQAIAVIGDSTFIHSGIGSLINTVYNKGSATILILENGTTAMTGGQNHPTTGGTLQGGVTPRINFEDLARAAGAKNVLSVDAKDAEKLAEIIKQELVKEQVSVIIVNCDCPLFRGKDAKQG